MSNKTNNTRIRLNSLALSAAIISFVASIGNSVYAQEVSKNQYAGTGVYEAVIADKDGTIYVTSAGSRNEPGGAIYKLHPGDLSIIDSIPLRETPPFGIALNNKTNTLYTSNTRTNSVSAVDAKTGKVLAKISNGQEKSHTRELIVDEDKNLIYVSDVGDPSSIWVIDGKTNTYQYSLENIGKTTTGLALSKNNDKLYVTNMGTNEIGVIDLESRKLEKSFPSGGESPVNLVVDHKNDRLFVTNQGSGTVSVLDVASGELIKSIETGKGAIGIAYDAKLNRLYSANRQTGTTTVIDAKDYKVLADLPTGSHPNNVKVSKKTGAAYVVNKTKSARPVEGQPAPPTDTNGDTVTLILP